MTTLSETVKRMLRKQSTNGQGTDCLGDSFLPPVVEAVWQKGEWVRGSGVNEIRKDVCGAPMKRGYHGVTTASKMGWEIDHIVPVARDGGDDLKNLQPLQWQNNRRKSDNHITWKCEVGNRESCWVGECIE